MNERLRDLILEELRHRGYREHRSERGRWLDAPNETMSVGPDLLDGYDVFDFLDWMCVRREKMYWSVEAVGREAATNSYNDVIHVVEAVKSVLRRELHER